MSQYLSSEPPHGSPSSSTSPSPRVRALVGSPKRRPIRSRVARLKGCVGEEATENGPSSVGSERGNVMRRVFSKSAGDLHNRSRSNDRSADNSPQSSPKLHHKKVEIIEDEGEKKLPVQRTSAAAFFTSLKTKFQRTRSRDGKPGIRRQELLDGNRSNSQPDVSVARGDSTTDYAADTSADLSTTLSFSPRRPPLLHSHTTAGREADGDVTLDSSSGVTSFARNAVSFDKPAQDPNLDPAIARSRALRMHSFYQLTIELKRGKDLVPKDSCGTSDPYVKFKVAGKLAYKSKTIQKDLNPVWDETVILAIEDPFEPVQMKVFDYDWGLQDDFMGQADIEMSTLDLDKYEERELTLVEPGNDDYMGTITVGLKIVPKSQEEKESYLQKGGSKLAEQQRKLKNTLWSSVVTIVLVDGKDLLPMDPDGFSDPYVKFKLGTEKHKSKPDSRTLNPKWMEQFDFHLFDDQTNILEVSVWDKDARSKDDFMGKAVLDLTEYEREKTHDIWSDLLDGAGSVHILLTISGITSMECVSDLQYNKDDPKELAMISNNYKFTRSFQNTKDVGFLTAKIFRAQGLASADIGGKSDPFCVLELNNDRVQTHTEYKTLTPTWNKVFKFNVRDIHSVLEVTVYDEDRDHKVEFLGKISVPLLRIINGEKKWYALKDKKMRMRAKGNYPEILMELTVYWNTLRAAMRTFTPVEEKYMQREQKFNRQIFIRNVNRMKGTIAQMVEGGILINRIFTWENPIQSGMAFVGFLLGVYYFEMYMIPLGLLGLFFKNYVVISLVGSLMHKEDELETSSDNDEDEDDERDKITKEEEKKSLKERLMAIQEVTATVQNAIGFIASMQESVKNTFNFSVPFLSWLMVIALAGGTLVLYYVPLRALVLLVGINKFLKQLLRPNAINNNELLDFLARVPDDENLRDYREIRLSPTMMEERRREIRKRKNQ